MSDCQVERCSAETPLEFGNETQMYDAIQPLSPNNFEKGIAIPVATKSPSNTFVSLPSPEMISIQGTRVSPSGKSDLDDDGCNPLLAATLRSDAKMVTLLAAKGADLEQVDTHGRSALTIAVEKDDSALALALLELGADIRTVDRSGQDLFQKAAAYASVTMLKMLLEWCREASERSSDPGILKRCVNKRDSKGRTLIHAAALQGKCEVVELLLEYGADVNASSR